MICFCNWDSGGDEPVYHKHGGLRMFTGKLIFITCRRLLMGEAKWATFGLDESEFNMQILGWRLIPRRLTGSMWYAGQIYVACTYTASWDNLSTRINCPTQFGFVNMSGNVLTSDDLITPYIRNFFPREYLTNKSLAYATNRIRRYNYLIGRNTRLNLALNYLSLRCEVSM